MIAQKEVIQSVPISLEPGPGFVFSLLSEEPGKLLARGQADDVHPQVIAEQVYKIAQREAVCGQILFWGMGLYVFSIEIQITAIMILPAGGGEVGYLARWIENGPIGVRQTGIRGQAAKDKSGLVQFRNALGAGFRNA